MIHYLESTHSHPPSPCVCRQKKAPVVKGEAGITFLSYGTTIVMELIIITTVKPTSTLMYLGKAIKMGGRYSMECVQKGETWIICYKITEVRARIRRYFFYKIYVFEYTYICLYMYVYICMCIYIYIYIYIYIFIFVYMYMYIYKFIYKFIYTYMYVYIYLYIYICICIYIYKFIYTYICMYIYIYIHIYVCIYIYIYIYIYTYINKCTFHFRVCSS